MKTNQTIYEYLCYLFSEAMFVFWKMVYGKSFSKVSCVCLLLEKLVNIKHFPIKEKFGRKTLCGSCEKFRNVILFADYIKFGSQTFDYYIYFVLNIYFSISSLKI